MNREITQSHDGEGRALRRAETWAGGASAATTYYVHSSALGVVVTELDAQGAKSVKPQNKLTR